MADERADRAADRAGEAADERLLAAVRAEVIEVGLHKLSATSVARRAGVARITLYRRGGDVKRLVLSALTKEIDDIIASARRGLPGPDRASARGRLVELAVRLVTGVAESELVRAIVGSDLRLLEPYFTDHLGASQRDLLAAVAPDLARGTADGSVRHADPEVLAMVLLQALTPFAVGSRLQAQAMGADVVTLEIRRLVDGYLRPTEAPMP